MAVVAAATPRDRDELFEVVAEVCYGAGLSYGAFELTSTNRSRINKALPDLRRIGVTPSEVRGYAGVYRTRSPDYSLKPQTIVENITEYRNKQNGGKPSAEHRNDGEELAAGTCAQCDGLGVVCPTCRGGRMERMTADTLAYQPCPDCQQPMMRDGEQVYDKDKKRYRWERNAHGEAQAIRAYRTAQVLA
jgi:hypothetical protein